jgi:hypothetical protein
MKLTNELSEILQNITNEINAELLDKKVSHLYNGELVKVFKSTLSKCDVNGWTATAEIMEGKNKGKWTTVFMDKATSVKLA